jgi:hypothetical protein
VILVILAAWSEWEPNAGNNMAVLTGRLPSAVLTLEQQARRVTGARLR